MIWAAEIEREGERRGLINEATDRSTPSLFATHLRFSFDETQVPLSRLGFPSDSLQKKNDALVGLRKPETAPSQSVKGIKLGPARARTLIAFIPIETRNVVLRAE